MRLLPLMLLIWMLPVMLSPIQAIFEATADWTGWIAFVPLAAVLIVIVGGGLVIARIVSRRV